MTLFIKRGGIFHDKSSSRLMSFLNRQPFQIRVFPLLVETIELVRH